MTVAEQRIDVVVREGLRREKTQSVSEWADEFRNLSAVASAEPGRWRTSRTPYLRAIMDALTPEYPAKKVVVMAGAQIGKTECGNNWLGHIIHRSPGPVLYVEPTLDTVKKVSRQRITPMIESSPVLASLVSEPRARDSGNTVQVKSFKGGLLIMTGANSAAGLRSMPVRYLFCDEVDEYPGDVDGQGDPVALAEKRTATFTRRKILLTSTPTVKGLSRIEREYLNTDQRRYFVPCPACGHMDWLQWTAGGWRGEEGLHHSMEWLGHDPSSIRMKCSACSVLVEERHKTGMLARGEWRPTADSVGGVVGFHLSSLYSPLGWKSWSECLAEFFDAKGDPFKLKTWVNTVLGETWEERGDAVDVGTLAGRRETYPAPVPHGVGVLVASADVQNDRIEVAVKGYGDREESWLIAHARLYGDPVGDKVWHELAQFLERTYAHESGRELKVSLSVCDSGGLHTEQVYKFCKASLLAGRNMFPIKGGSIPGKPLVGKPSKFNRYRIPLYVLCVDTGKDIVMGRMQVGTPGPGYMHLPDWVDEEYLSELTAERAVHKYVKGRGAVRSWVKVHDRNEAFDLEVYALAALYMLGSGVVVDLNKRAAALSSPPGEGDVLSPTGSLAPHRGTNARRTTSWTHRWR